MATSWGRKPITNADKRHLTMTKYIVADGKGDSEERIDRRPMGKVERFVDPSGAIVSLQLYADGDPKRAETEIRQRAALHKKGFVEYAKCPIRHGTRHSCPQTTRDFARIKGMPQEECRTDPKVMERVDGELHAKTACVHIEALVKYRRDEAAKAYLKRNSHIERAEKRDAEKRAIELATLELIQKSATDTRKPKVKDATE